MECIAAIACMEAALPSSCFTRPIPYTRLPKEAFLLLISRNAFNTCIPPCPQAFNNAFLSIGMDCVTWTPPIYNDLLGCCDGTGEGLITAYYTTGGCPLINHGWVLPTIPRVCATSGGASPTHGARAVPPAPCHVHTYTYTHTHTHARAID